MIDFDEIKSFHEDAEALKDITPEKAIPLLEAKMAALGADQELVKELLESQAYRERADRCLLNLNTLVRKHGPGIALVMLYKNRTALLGQGRDSVLREIQLGLKKVAQGSPALAKYQNIKNTLTVELGLPEEAALLVLAKINKGCEDRLLEDLNLLIARVQREKLRAILLRSPHMLSSRTNLEAILSRTTPAEVIDEEKLVRSVLEEAQGRRPEAFVRAIVLANSGSFVSQTPARAWTYVEYKARILLGMGTTHGVPQEFILACMEKGMTDFAAIKKEFVSRPATAGPSATADTERAPSQAPPAPSTASHRAEEEVRKPAADVASATPGSAEMLASGEKIGEPLLEKPIVATSEGAAMAAPAEPASKGISEQGGIFAALSKFGINDDIRKDILSRSMDNPGCDALSRITAAISLFEQCAKPGQQINGFVKEFFTRRATRDALFEPVGHAFDDAVIEAAERLSSQTTRPSSPPSARNGGGKNGLKHITIPAGDIPIFEKIRSFPIPEDVQMYLESRHLDAHEFSYVVLKMLRWITNRQPQPQTEEVYKANAAKVAGDAAAEVLKVITPMMNEARHGNSTYFEVRSESEMDEASRVIFKVLKQVKFTIG